MKKILVVDDNVDSARMLEMLLETMGHQARAAMTGTEALAAAREQVPDIALLDLTLPDMTGFELARRLRQMPELAATKLVAVTGWSDPDVEAEARASGFSVFLVKPVAIDDLAKTVA